MLLATGCSDDSQADAPSSDPAEFAADVLTEATRAQRAAEARGVTTTTEPAPLNPTDIPGEPVNQFELATGDCFERIEDLRDGRPNTITTKLPCAEPHGFEIFHMLRYPAEHPSVYPGETVVRSFALESCYREFESWVGQEYEVSELEIDVIIPPQENFENDAARYRGIHCWVERVDGDPMVGTSRLSGW